MGKEDLIVGVLLGKPRSDGGGVLHRAELQREIERQAEKESERGTERGIKREPKVAFEGCGGPSRVPKTVRFIVDSCDRRKDRWHFRYRRQNQWRSGHLLLLMRYKLQLQIRILRKLGG